MEGRKGSAKGKGPKSIKGKGTGNNKFAKKGKGKNFSSQDGKKKFSKGKPHSGKGGKGPSKPDKPKTFKPKTFDKTPGGKPVGKEGAKKRKFVSDKEDKSGKKQKVGEEDTKEIVPTVKLHELKKKDRKEFRKKHTEKDSYDLLVWMKKTYETLRRKNVESEKKHPLIDEVLEKIAGHGHDVAFKHDTGRVIQTCIQYGTGEQRTKLFNQFKDDLVDLVKSKYSKFFVKKLLKYGTKEERAVIVKCFYGKVRRLISQKEASEVLETVYSDYANAAHRSALLQEFYGPEFALFKDTEPKTLGQILEENPTKKVAIIKNMHEALTPLATKTGMNHTIVHKALCEFFIHAEGQPRAEMIEAIRESVVYILHTHDGARVAMQCLWHGTTKDRKIIVKSFKTFVLKMCKEEFGHLVMLAMFDTVDDTVLIKKALFPEMIEGLSGLMNDQYGRKVISYLLSHRQPPFCHPKIAEILKMGDSNAYSKKDPEARRKELLDELSQHLLKLITENTKELLQDKPKSVLIPLIIAKASGDVLPAMTAIVDLVAKDLDPQSDKEDHVLQSPSGHLVVKHLIQQDKDRLENKENPQLFASLLLAKIEPEQVIDWCQFNRGSFVVASLLESSVEKVPEAIKKQIKPTINRLKKFPSKGLEIVLKHLT